MKTTDAHARGPVEPPYPAASVRAMRSIRSAV
jgi:hypothetical protein